MTADTFLTLIAPQFASSANRAGMLEFAELNVNEDLFGVKTQQAIAFYAAHLLVLFNDPLRSNGESGAITSKKEGDLSVNFGGLSGGTIDESLLATTSFGQSFLLLRNGTLSGISVMGYEEAEPWLV